MSSLIPEKLHVTYLQDTSPSGLSDQRFYTLTHSDQTGDLFLSIGAALDQQAVSGWYTRFMRDEVLAEWLLKVDQPELHVHCHVSGGFTFGSARWRYSIFQHHLKQVLQAFCFGDRDFLEAYPEYMQSPIYVHFHSSNQRYNRVEHHGCLADYKIG